MQKYIGTKLIEAEKAVRYYMNGGNKIVIADSGEEAAFDISGSGRGWYLTKTQIAVAEYVLECLEKDASKDPLADIFDHKTISKKNTYTF